MTAFEANNCDTARVTLSTDEIGRTWEHFYLGQNYIFSNQIPNRQSFTTTDPGLVIYQRALCHQSHSPAPPAPPAPPAAAAAAAAGETAVMSIIFLLGIAGAGVYAWFAKRDDSDGSGYHPMADVPDLPWVFWRRSAADEPPTSTDDHPMNESGDGPLFEDGGGGQNWSEPSDDGAIEVPWDEPAAAVDEPAAAVNSDTVPTSPYGLDKLRGMSMKQFKEQLAKHGITPESGAFKSVELLKFEGTAAIIEKRMMAFWQEFGSRRIPHAIYFVFGLQDGGNRSVKFKENYSEAKLWVSNWIKENLPSE